MRAKQFLLPPREREVNMIQVCFNTLVFWTLEQFSVERQTTVLRYALYGDCLLPSDKDQLYVFDRPTLYAHNYVQ